MPVTSAPYRTSDDLVLEALANLGVLTPGQPVAPEDFAYVNSKLDAIFRKLSGLELVYVSDSAQIPGEWFSDLASIVAGEVAFKFGATGDNLGSIINQGLGGYGPVPVLGGTAAQSLKIMLRGRPTGEPQRTESF